MFTFPKVSEYLKKKFYPEFFSEQNGVSTSVKSQKKSKSSTWEMSIHEETYE